MDTNWYNNLNTPDDLKRLTSAQKSECAPLSLDKEKQVGSFTGKHGSYTASMYECTCVDFMRRKLPCKHDSPSNRTGIYQDRSRAQLRKGS